jgi:hypothetical protein
LREADRSADHALHHRDRTRAQSVARRAPPSAPDRHVCVGYSTAQNAGYALELPVDTVVVMCGAFARSAKFG